MKRVIEYIRRAAVRRAAVISRSFLVDIIAWKTNALEITRNK